MNELFSIAGKVAVITGAGGVLGGNIAQHFVQQGAKVVAIYNPQIEMFAHFKTKSSFHKTKRII